jgi:LysM repeat protein
MLRRAPVADVRRVKYRVKRGDTLERIAERFDVSIEALRSWNRRVRGDRIHPGDVLLIERSRR